MVQVRLQCLFLLAVLGKLQIGLMLPLTHLETGLTLPHVEQKSDDSYSHWPNQELSPVPEFSIAESRPLPIEDVPSDDDRDKGRKHYSKQCSPEEPLLGYPSPAFS
jgi:hypothetical protein